MRYYKYINVETNRPVFFTLAGKQSMEANKALSAILKFIGECDEDGKLLVKEETIKPIIEAKNNTASSVEEIFQEQINTDQNVKEKRQYTKRQ